MNKDLWQDSFVALGNALTRLKEVLDLFEAEQKDYLKDAAIQRFEFCVELYWKTLKRFLAYEKAESTTPRDVLEKSFQFYLIDDEQIWLSILDDRNSTSHVYKQELALQVFERIKTYYPIMEKTYQNLKTRYKKM